MGLTLQLKGYNKHDVTLLPLIAKLYTKHFWLECDIMQEIEPIEPTNPIPRHRLPK